MIDIDFSSGFETQYRVPKQETWRTEHKRRKVWCFKEKLMILTGKKNIATT